MLNEDQLNKLPARLENRINSVFNQFLEKAGQRINEIGQLSATDIHRLTLMKQANKDIDEITQTLEQVTAKNAAEIQEIFDIVAADNVQFSEKFMGSAYIPYAENRALQMYVTALATQSVKDYVNMSQNTAFLVYDKQHNKVLTSLAETYTNIIDDAIVAVTTGQTDFYSAVRGSMTQLADSGLRTKYTPLKGAAGKAVDYATGYSRRLDTAVRQNVLWGVKQCNLGIQEQVGAEFGADGWEIDYHSNPRPSHAEMGGRQYAAGKGRIIDGIYYPPFSDISGYLQDYGCLHFKWAIILGVSEPNHSHEELRKMKELDKATFEFDGEVYTRYELSQIQRKLETAARHAKDRQIIAKAAGDDELRRKEQAKINLIASKYKKVSDAAGLPTKAERMAVGKYHRVKTLEELDPNYPSYGSPIHRHN